MEKSTVVTLLIVVGLGGLVLWWYTRQAAAPSATQGLPPSCGSGVMGSIGNFIKGHVDRKNSLAPVIGQTYTKAPAAVLKPITDIAGKLSPSGYVEQKVGNAVGDFLCSISLKSLSQIGNAALNAGSFAAKEGTKAVTTGVKVSTSFGTSQLKAGTVGPVGSIYNAGDNLVHGNFGDAATNIKDSIIDGPKSAVTSTYNALKSLNPF
jgi:hypothetical protein